MMNATENGERAQQAPASQDSDENLYEMYEEYFQWEWRGDMQDSSL